MTPGRIKFRRQLVARMREYLADPQPRPPELVTLYRETIARLEGELSHQQGAQT